MPEISAQGVKDEEKRRMHFKNLKRKIMDRDLQLEGVDQPEGEVHQDEQTHCLPAGMRRLTFPKKKDWKGFESKF